MRKLINALVWGLVLTIIWLVFGMIAVYLFLGVSAILAGAVGLVFLVEWTWDIWGLD